MFEQLRKKMPAIALIYGPDTLWADLTPTTRCGRVATPGWTARCYDFCVVLCQTSSIGFWPNAHPTCPIRGTIHSKGCTRGVNNDNGFTDNVRFINAPS